MSSIDTTKLDELFRRLPKNSGIDPRLVEDAKTELSVLRLKAEGNGRTHRQKSWNKTETDKLKDKLLEKEAEIAHLQRQLRDGGRMVAPQERFVSDRLVAIKNRYMDLYDGEWSEAYDFFRERGWTEVEIIVTLQRILRASYSLCQDVAQEQLQNIEGEALYPTASWMDDSGIINRMTRKQISKEVAEIARLYQKTTAQECLPALQKAFTRQVLPTFIDPTKFKSNVIENYSKSCVEVTWYMCVQDPQMVIVDRFERGSDFNPDLFRKFTKYGGNKFDYLVWPALLLHRNGPIVVKGVAQTIPARERQPLSKRNTPENLINKTDENSERRAKTPEDDVEYDRGYEPPVLSRHGSPVDRLANETPPKVYKKAPDREDGPEPGSPYFDPHETREIPKINVLPSTSDVEKHKHRHSYRKAATHYHESKERLPGEKLTVFWKDRKEERIPSAP